MMTKKSIYLIISILFIFAALLLALATAVNQSFMVACYVNVSYYLTALLVFLWFAVLFGHTTVSKPDVKEFFRQYGLGILFCFILTAMIFITVKPYFRVLDDEANLLSVSQSMTFDRKVSIVIQGKMTYFNFRPIHILYPKRPFLFPFFSHLLHVIFGYQPYHPFVVNFLSLGTIFSLIFILLKKYWGMVAALAGVFLVAAQPLIVQTATSAAFDLFFVLFVALALMSLASKSIPP